MLTSIKPATDETTEAELLALEKLLNAKLPPSYRAFLLKTNGGEPLECGIDFAAPKLKRKGDTVSYFFEVSDDPTYGIAPMMEDFGSDIPPGMIFIGNSPGGNYFLLSLRPGSYGQVFYKDHDFEDKTPFDEAKGLLPESIVKIADSFEEFQARLYDPDA
jgi:cell wall assembly regulator SMI1